MHEDVVRFRFASGGEGISVCMRKSCVSSHRLCRSVSSGAVAHIGHPEPVGFASLSCISAWRCHSVLREFWRCMRCEAVRRVMGQVGSGEIRQDID